MVHPFVNGNKRTAYELTRLFLRLNGYDLQPESEDAYRFLLRVADSTASMKEVETWRARNLAAGR
jgi:death-on-curing protein